MFATRLQHAFLLIALAIPTTASAQKSFNGYELPGVGYQPSPWLPPELGLSYHHASTVAEGWLRGCSAVIHACGSYWLNYSQAAILFEYARSLDTYNRRQWIELHAWNRQRLRAEVQQRIDAKRSRNQAERVTRYETAYRLISDELDRTTGAIRWPVVLQTPEFEAPRLNLEKQFRERARYGASSDDGSVQIDRCVKSMRQTLRHRIKEMSAAEYLAAHKFLIGLEHDDEFAADDAASPNWHATLAGE